MSALDVVRVIISKMSAEERKVAISALKIFNTRGSSTTNLALELFEIICSGIDRGEFLSKEQLEKRIYGKSNPAPFSELIYRLRNRILESLTLSINIDRRGIYSERSKALHTIRRDISIAQIIQSRGADDIAVDILDDVVKLASKYEHFEECLSAIHCLINLSAFQPESTSKYEYYLGLYDKYLKSMVAVKRANMHYSFWAKKDEHSIKSIEVELLQTHIKELERELTNSGASTVAYCLTFLEVFYYQLQKSYKQASKVLEKQIELVEVHPALFSESLLVLAKINKAQNDIYQHKFTSAIQIIQGVKNKAKNKGFNYQQGLLVETYAYIYKGLYELALSNLDILDTLDSGKDAEFRNGKRKYLRACVFFILNQFDKVHYILMQLNPVENDKEGWNLYLRVLLIMNHIQIEQFEAAHKAIISLKKQLDRIGKSATKSLRIELIIDVLNCLANNHFDFAEVNKKKAEIIDALENSSNVYWSVLTPEIIVFQSWFNNQLKTHKKIPYQNLPNPQYQKQIG